MSSNVSNFIIQTLCDNQGSMDFKSLSEKLQQRFTVAASILRQVFLENEQIAVLPGVLAVGAGQILSPDSVIVAKTALRICQRNPSDCTQCHSLHLCKFYVLGTCAFGFRCKNPHGLTGPHNVALLNKFNLQHLTDKQLFQLLLQNDPYLLPEICSHYNMGKGQHGSCKFASACTKLHICQPHLTAGACKLGSSCCRSHNMDVKSHKSFEKCSQEMVNKLPKIYKNKCIITDHQSPASASAGALRGPARHLPSSKPTPSVGTAQPASDPNRKDICLFFISKRCSFGDKCIYDHWHLPYRWQVLDSDGVTWKDLTDMEAIEKAYCDPAQESICVDQSLTLDFSFLRPKKNSRLVDFMRMTYKDSEVRRLSTASSVMKPPHFILTTQWVWYWKDDNGKWKEFGQSDVNKPACLTSETLEKMYAADQTTQISFSAGDQQYVMHFSGDEAGTQRMYQQNVKYLTKREVRRRPCFVSAHDVEDKRQRSSSLKAEFPEYWAKKALPDIGYKFVPLPMCTEYHKIECLFKATMPKSTIKSIRRIQNPSLWTAFQWQREQMKKRNGGKPVNEQYLFHGTSETLIEAICEQNFDWRMSGVHGTAYGKGSYFAKEASYSHRYATARDGVNKSMFVALVLVGDYTQGQSSYVRPPPKGKSTALYDSCVDNVNDPKIFVIFEKLQMYPEYIIDYS
ncbi:protein mono-ADP-ribosyltransferase PARP12 [Dunckerocampus dactyliophorus]|uniref:protein mono-ADP-ribosyltransferase PARP12 n=1 Tax=Dunckerocampus dactyliophorus TaxID=161453 RepID=UPI002406C57F|nr:protein mono-ADP-ribosyltransferase PARP12 [Dunckerocampus dactyliophorus]